VPYGRNPRALSGDGFGSGFGSYAATLLGLLVILSLRVPARCRGPAGESVHRAIVTPHASFSGVEGLGCAVIFLDRLITVVNC
jgi:hypothetical protein